MYAYYELGRTSTHDHPDSGGRHMSSLQDSRSHRPERHKQLESRTQGPSTARIQGVRYSTRQESLEPVATTALGRRMVAVCRLGAPSTFLGCSARHCDGKSSLHAQDGRNPRLLAASQMP